MTVMTCGETVTASPGGLGGSVSALQASAWAAAAASVPGTGQRTETRVAFQSCAFLVLLRPRVT